MKKIQTAATRSASRLEHSLPADLAHPSDPGRASYIANLVAVGALACVTLALLLYAVLG